MEKNFPQISASQLFCMLLLSRLSAETVSPHSAANPAAALTELVITEVIRFLPALPIIIYSFGRDNFYRDAYKKSHALGWAAAITGSLMLLGTSVRSLVLGTQFAEKNLLPGKRTWLIFALAAAFAVYAAYMGVEALARTSTLFLAAAGVVTVTVLLADIPYMQATAVWGERELGDVSAGVIARLMNSGDYLAFAALLPYVKRKRDASAGISVLFYALVSTLSAGIICAAGFLILREMYGLCGYPSAAAASLADIGIFKRLDGFFSAAWSLCAAFRSAFLLTAARCAVIEVYRAASSEPKRSSAEQQPRKV